MMKNKGFSLALFPALLSVVLILLSAVAPETFQGWIYFVILMVFAAHLILGRTSFEETALSVMGVFLFTWTLTHLILIRQSFPAGFIYIFLGFFITWATDTGAYFTGRCWGRHKLSPRISPNKTVEGALGGVVLALGTAFLLRGYLPETDTALLLILTFCASLAGQAGDLLESAVKRWAGVKDSGRLIPGHGGILDRFDSMTLVAPIIYYFLKYFLLG